ncbi:MAG TPA: putative peptidoglycan glycosyltransferase FtsW [Micromonosporaceae bacterium]
MALLRGVLDRPLASYYLLLASSSLLLLIGLVMVFSATSVEAYVNDGDAYASVRKQAISAVVGLVGFWIFQRLPARTYRALGAPLLVASAIMLAVLDVLAFVADMRTPPGQDVTPVRLGPLYGDGLWLYLGPLQLQPAEIAKLALALWAARLLARKGPTIGWWRELATPLFPVAAGIMVLVGINDLGTMLCLLILFVGLLWSAGVRLRVFAAMSAVALSGIAMLVALPGKAKWRGARLTAFLDPSACDQQAACYQARQGRYAIADGGWFGVGLGESRGKWGWLPNGHNDFIFAVIAEELGVVGSLVVLALLAVLAYTGLRIARRVDDPFRRMVAAGITFWLVGQAVINIGGVVGLLPITGLPLPFISDGGSALVVTMSAVGLLASFARAEPDAARALHARPPAKWMRLVWAPLPPLPRQRRTRSAAGRGAAGRGEAPGARARPTGATGRGDAERRR